MIFWKNIVNFVGMKQSIDFLPERKQQDLHELVAIVRKEIKDVVMIILYGSYARNTYVECDERYDFGVRTFYISDYDILVVTKKRLGGKESTVGSRIRSEFLGTKNNPEFYTRPQIINESIKELNNALSEGHYFYVDILTQGIILYDSGEYQLATPRDLNFCEIEKKAQKYYVAKFRRGMRFMHYTQVAYRDKEYVDASFFLHQSTESLLKTIPLIYILYGYKEHDLEFLIEKCKPYTMELAKVFPRDTPEEKRLFNLLRSAYVEARYNDDFVVTKTDIEALTPKIERLREIVENVCRDRIEYYERQITK
jgi:HEPN domain